MCEGSVLGCNLDRSIVMYKIVRIPLRGAQDDAGSDHLKALFGVKFKNQWGEKIIKYRLFLVRRYFNNRQYAHAVKEICHWLPIEVFHGIMMRKFAAGKLSVQPGRE